MPKLGGNLHPSSVLSFTMSFLPMVDMVDMVEFLPLKKF